MWFTNWHAETAAYFTQGGQTEITARDLKNIEHILSTQKVNLNYLTTLLRKANTRNHDYNNLENYDRKINILEKILKAASFGNLLNDVISSRSDSVYRLFPSVSVCNSNRRQPKLSGERNILTTDQSYRDSVLSDFIEWDNGEAWKKR